MKKFVFSMESLLKIKISLEKQLKNKLAEAEQKLNQCIAELNELIELKSNLKVYFINNTDSTNSYDLKAFNLYYSEVEKRRINQVNAVEAARNAFQDVQRQLLEVMAERKMYEKLKEKQYTEYLFELRQEQDKIIDDILSYKITKSQEV